jgi:hypothetical protein
MSIKPVSGVVSFEARQRTLFVAEAMKRLVTQVSTAKPDVLLSLLNDTENLSAFVRYSTLPNDVKAELLLEISRHAAGGTRLSDRSLAKLNDVLGGIRPQSAGGDVTYQDNAAADVRSMKKDALAYSLPASVNFVAFRPGQSDFEKTIDNIALDVEPGDETQENDQIFGVPPLVMPARDTLSMGLTLLVVSIMIGIVVVGFWIF